MAQITINVTNAQLAQEIADAFETTFQMPHDEQGNPQYTPTQFVKFQILEYIKRVVNQYRHDKAMEQVNITKVDSIE